VLADIANNFPAPTLLPREPRSKHPLKISTITFGTSRYLQTYLSGDYSTTETQFRTFTDPLPWSGTLQRTVTLTMEVPIPAKTPVQEEATIKYMGAGGNMLQGFNTPEKAESSALQPDPSATIHGRSHKSVTKSITITTTFVKKVPWPRTKSNVFPRSKFTTTFIEEIPDNKPYPVTTSIILEMPWPPTSRPLPSTSKGHWWNYLWPHPASPTTTAPHKKFTGVAHQILPVTKKHTRANEKSMPTQSARTNDLVVRSWDRSRAYSPSETMHGATMIRVDA